MHAGAPPLRRALRRVTIHPEVSPCHGCRDSSGHPPSPSPSSSWRFPPTHAPRTPHTREGFWFNIGLGAGSLGCSDCDERTSGLSGGLALGGTINQNWLLGAFSNGWTKSEDGVTLTADNGSGTLLGVGWDLRVGKTVSLTPFWNGIGMSFSDGGDANFGQIGIGLTIH
jgi:hypothetical protein